MAGWLFTKQKVMMRRLTFLFLQTLFAIGPPLFAQICGSRSGPPMQMQVQLTFGDQANDTAPGAVVNQNDSIHRGDVAGVERSRDFATNMQIRVQLQDPTAGTLQELAPGSDGQLRMMVCKNSVYRIRVTGPTIEEAIVDSVQPGRGDNLVTVVLHRKLTKEERKAKTGTVSAQQLRVPQKAQKQLEKGDAALKKGQLAEAEKLYARAVSLYPRFEQAENNLGIVLMQEGKKAEGRAAFEHSVALNPMYAPAQINLAKIAFDEKRFADANKLARLALASEPMNTSGLFIAAESAFFKGDYAETVSYANTLHSLPHSQYGLVHFLAAKSLEAEHHPDAALREYQAFLEEDPNDPNAKRARELMNLLQASRVAKSQNGSPQ